LCLFCFSLCNWLWLLGWRPYKQELNQIIILFLLLLLS
jgi:hypothetical protein